MHTIDFTIELKSDAEPGTGTGGDIVNDRVPRNAQRQPIIPATHLKGLMREELQKIEFLFQETGNSFENLTDDCLGKPGPLDGFGNGNDGQEACFFISDAKPKDKDHVETSFVSRTAIDSNSGVAKETSLRTTERIPIGTEFHGKLILNVPTKSRKGLAVQLALFSIAAIGGGRNRGCGQCVIHSTTCLGTLFDELCKAEDKAPFRNSLNTDNVAMVTLQLIFEAESPVCCPETPVRGNVIKSGFVIPASAVQGFILNHLDKRFGEEVTTKCFQSENFRAWPLLPCSRNINDDHQYPIPTRVSLTHKVAKLVAEGEELDGKTVVDEAIEEYDWKKTDELNPLKASDGVLLRSQDGNVQIWKSRSMPRIVSAHGVLNDPNTKDGRNFFQIESMAPIVWSGIVRIPEFATQALMDTFATGHTAVFGRNRSIRGMGTLIVRRMDDGDKTLPWNMENKDTKMPQAVIVQSPILLDDTKQPGQSAKEIFKDFVKTKWFEKTDNVSIKVYGCVEGIQFGWNRTKVEQLSQKRTGKGNRVQACRIIQPGAVIVFKNEIDKKLLAKCIQKGLGDGREQGFGAVALHPGKAGRIFGHKKKQLPIIESDEKEKAAIEGALGIWHKHKSQLPSASQIAAVRDFLLGENNPQQNALNYLERQKSGRTGRIWAVWEKCYEDVKNYIEKHDSRWAEKGLKLIADMIISEAKISEASEDQEKK